MQVNSIPRILCLTLALLPTLIFAQPMAPHVRKGVPQEVLLQSKSLNCGDIVYSLQVINNGSGCCYRLKADNSNPDNCFVNVALNLDMGAFANFIALPGWQYNTGGPAEYTVRPFMGFIPPGSSSLAEFCIDGTTSATLTLLWEDLCVLEGCAATFDVNGCLDPGDASITGVAYLECESLPYSNQVTLPDWTIQLLDTMDNVIAEQVTDMNGAYAFYDLPKGQYICRQTTQPGWTPRVPASGQTTVDLSASEHEVRNFGNCRANCLCSSIQTSVIPLSSTPTECCYNLKTQVLGGGGYCFQYLNVQVDAGQFITSWIPQTGWIFTQINPQSIKIAPISGIIPLGTYVPGSICISGNGTHNILVTAGFEDSAGPHECDASYSFNCPPPQNPCACPSGFPGNNLCINGNFSGLGGFTSNYVLNNVGPLLEGQFWVGSNPSLINAGFQACGDHTSGSGNMMVVNGATNASTRIWCETITVSANTNYQFGAWIASLAAASPAQLQLFVNNVSVGGSFQASAQPCDWQQYCQSWFSGTNTTATICLVNLNPSAPGNDFALDDLSFRACVSISNCVRGTVYVACDTMPFTNQPTLSGWTISLLDTMGVVLDTIVTDSTGAYAFCNLVPGNYVVKTSKPGWTSKVPPTGQYAVSLGQSQDLVRDFGVCQDCTTCPPPANFTVTTVNETEVLVNWDPQSVACGDQVCVWTWWEDADGLLHKAFFYYKILPPYGSRLFSVEPGVTNHIFAMTVCDSVMSISTDTIVYNYPCQASISITQGPNCTVQVTAVTAGSQPVSYQWCDGRTDASFTTSQLPCVPTTYCVTVTCSDGSTSSALVVFTAQDLTPPIAVCNPGVGVDLDANCAFQVTTGFVDGGSTDNCGIMSMSVSPTTLVGCANTIVTLTVTDWCGNTSTCSMGIQTKEVIPPGIACPVSVALNGTPDGQGSCSAMWLPSALPVSDNCDPAPTVASDAPLGNIYSMGTTTVTWIVMDACGNTRSCSSTVTVACPCDSMECPGNLVQNPGFYLGAVSGELDIDGLSADWHRNSVFPVVLSTDYCCDAYCMEMKGNEGICQGNLAFQQGHTYRISFCARFRPTLGQPGTIGFEFIADSDCLVGGNFEVMGVSNPIASTTWASYTLADWTATQNWNSLQIKAFGAFGHLDNICIYEVPQGCSCGTFSQIYARPSVGAPSIALSCGETYDFGCPNPGQSIPITGKFECQGTNCPEASQINWTLQGPSGGIINGTVQAGPYFYLPISPLSYAAMGTYTLTLQGNCGGTDCPPCVIKFNVNCTDPCPCDVPQFQKDVDKGFATALWNNSCNACFSPIALNDCDKVEWKVNNTSVGMTNGIQSFCHTFSSSGAYTIEMIVSRVKSNGDPCETFTYIKTVQITCVPPPVCDNSVFENPGFEEGAVAGGLNSGGASTGWLAPYGDPHEVINDGKWKIRLTGNLDTADVLSSETAMCVKKGPGTVAFRGSIVKSRSNIKNIALFFNTGDNYEFNVFKPESCFRIATLDLSQYDSSWFDLEIPYDLSSWAALDSCGDAPYGVLVKPIVYVNSFLGNDQGGEETRAEMELDQLCFNAALVGLNDLPLNNRLRIFPNPNPGTFTVQLPEPASPDLSFRIIGLTGQLLREQHTQTGSTMQTVQAGDLPAGLYFLQVRSEGRVLATEKFIKQ